MYQLETYDDNVVKLTVDGKVREEDYEKVIPELEDKLEEYDKLRLLAKIQDIEGIEPGAVWEDLKFFSKHFNDFERFAVVGDSSKSEWIAKLSKPFTAEVRHFDADESRRAEAWVRH